MTKERIEEAWRNFGDVPVNNKDEIERDFMYWFAGTDRFRIWHWFDEKYAQWGGVHALMHGEGVDSHAG